LHTSSPASRRTCFWDVDRRDCGGAEQTNKPAAPNPASAAGNAASPAIAEQADRLIKQVGAYIGSAQQFTFHADVTFDHVLPSGRKLQFASAEEVVLQRPGRLYVEWNGDLGSRQFWYDGKSVTLYDPVMPFYASEAAPPELDNMLAQLLPKLNSPASLYGRLVDEAGYF